MVIPIAVRTYPATKSTKYTQLNAPPHAYHMHTPRPMGGRTTARRVRSLTRVATGWPSSWW